MFFCLFIKDTAVRSDGVVSVVSVVIRLYSEWISRPVGQGAGYILNYRVPWNDICWMELVPIEFDKYSQRNWCFRPSFTMVGCRRRISSSLIAPVHKPRISQREYRNNFDFAPLRRQSTTNTLYKIPVWINKYESCEILSGQFSRKNSCSILLLLVFRTKSLLVCVLAYVIPVIAVDCTHNNTVISN